MGAGSVWVMNSDVNAGQGNGITSGEAVALNVNGSAFLRVRDSRVGAATTGPTRWAVGRRDSSTIRINSTAISGSIIGSPSCVSVFDYAANPVTR